LQEEQQLFLEVNRSTSSQALIKQEESPSSSMAREFLAASIAWHQLAISPAPGGQQFKSQ
jgi:hypothetical protein